jgi:Zn-dependent protease
MLLAFPVFLLCLTVHEFAHALMAKLGGDRTSEYLGRLTLNPVVHIDVIGTLILPVILLMVGLPPFGWAKPVPVNTLRLRKAVWMVYVALAGPASNLLLILLTAFIMKVVILVGVTPDFSFLRTGTITAGNVFWAICLWMVQVNAILAVFNMMPLPPLDGSRVVFHFIVRENPKLWPLWMALEGYLGIIVVYIAIQIPAIRALILGAVEGIRVVVFSLVL